MNGLATRAPHPTLLMTQRDQGLIPVSFHRTSLVHHAGMFTREGSDSFAPVFRRKVEVLALAELANARRSLEFRLEPNNRLGTKRRHHMSGGMPY